MADQDMPSQAELDASIPETEEDRIMARRRAYFDSRTFYGIIAIDLSAKQGSYRVDHVVSMTGEHLYWTVTTPQGVHTVYWRQLVYHLLSNAGAKLFDKCDAYPTKEEGASDMLAYNPNLFFMGTQLDMQQHIQ
ncbi:MAG: hypothetical protein ACXWQ5_01000 [Ktedonobacterales bacterium]